MSSESALTPPQTPLTVGLVSSEPISDPLLEGALRQNGIACVRIVPESGRQETLRRLWSCDLLLKSFGAYSPGYFRLFALARLLGKRIVVYWIGSDVLYAAAVHRTWARRIQWLVEANLTVTEALREELLGQGVRADVIPIVSDLRGLDVAPLPSRFTVLTYLPYHDHIFYGTEAVVELARRLPEIPFLVVGGPVPAHLPANVTDLGFVSNMQSVYRRASVLLRLTPHDGLPKMVLEALAIGRAVIWSQPFPHCVLARDAREAERAILNLRDSLVSNPDGAHFVQEHFAPETFAARLSAYVRAIKAKRR